MVENPPQGADQCRSKQEAQHGTPSQDAACVRPSGFANARPQLGRAAR